MMKRYTRKVLYRVYQDFADEQSDIVGTVVFMSIFLVAIALYLCHFVLG